MNSDHKHIAIIAHITLIGWIVSIVMHSNNRSEFGSFYLRQMLGLLIMQAAAGIVGIVPIIGWLAAIVLSISCIVFWIMSIVAAVNERTEESPVVGRYFQEWFASL